METPTFRYFMCVFGVFRFATTCLPSCSKLSSLRPRYVAMSLTPLKPLVIFVLGGPGAGKGTQCANIVRDFGFVHLSAGDLLRAARDSGSPDGKLIDDYIKDGRIVPVEITIGLIQQAMEACSVQKFLIDGFPRNANNLEGWEMQMRDKADIKFVLFFECPEQVCLERALKRGESGGRNDDNRESFVKRYRTYLESTMPIIEKYDKLGLVKKIDATPSPDEVFAVVRKFFDEL